MAKTPEEMTEDQNILRNERFLRAMDDDYMRYAEPTPPAPIAAQTEKCDVSSWGFSGGLIVKPPATVDTGAAGNCAECGDLKGSGTHWGHGGFVPSTAHSGKINVASTGDQVGNVTEQMGKEGKVTGDTPQPQDYGKWANTICGACQIMDAWKNEPEWSDWDRQIRAELTEILTVLYAGQTPAATGKTPDARQWLDEHWPLTRQGGWLFHRDIMVRVLEEFAAKLLAPRSESTDK